MVDRENEGSSHAECAIVRRNNVFPTKGCLREFPTGSMETRVDDASIQLPRVLRPSTATRQERTANNSTE